MDIKKQVQEHFAQHGGPTSGPEDTLTTPAEAIEPEAVRSEVITERDRTENTQVMMTVYESSKCQVTPLVSEDATQAEDVDQPVRRLPHDGPTTDSHRQIQIEQVETAGVEATP